MGRGKIWIWQSKDVKGPVGEEQDRENLSRTLRAKKEPLQANHPQTHSWV